MRKIIPLVMCGALIGLASCQQTQVVLNPDPVLELTKIEQLYGNGDMALVFVAADNMAIDERYDEESRYTAAFYAGKAAQEIGKLENAVVRFRQATRSTDNALKYESYAELGETLCQMERFEDGFIALRESTKGLKGELLAQAFFHTALAEQKLGYFTEARIHLLNAYKNTSNEALKEDVRSCLNISGYTIQVGSFTARPNALEEAAKWNQKCAELQIASPVVRELMSDNGRYFMVQLGKFSTWQSARQRMEKLGITAPREAMIVPMSK